jgi:molybdopterin-guanine dinucleotide biosynthesis protein A
MSTPADDITGFILAGGRSRRMGTDKARIAWGRGTLLTHAVDRMRQVASKVFVVGSVESAPVRVLPDVFPESGPLGGLQAALAQTVTDWNLVLAIDLPLVPAGLLRFITEQRKDGVSAVVPLTKAAGPATHSRRNSDNLADPTASLDWLQPLCGLYHRRVLSDFERALSHGEYSIHRLLGRLRTAIGHNKSIGLRTIDEHELIAAGFSADMFWNVNTPADLKRARTLATTLNV